VSLWLVVLECDHVVDGGEQLLVGTIHTQRSSGSVKAKRASNTLPSPHSSSSGAACSSPCIATGIGHQLLVVLPQPDLHTQCAVLAAEHVRCSETGRNSLQPTPGCHSPTPRIRHHSLSARRAQTDPYNRRPLSAVWQLEVVGRRLSKPTSNVQRVCNMAVRRSARAGRTGRAERLEQWIIWHITYNRA
jgi:hypothetical protein